jgi:hypothetical protein
MAGESEGKGVSAEETGGNEVDVTMAEVGWAVVAIGAGV